MAQSSQPVSKNPSEAKNFQWMEPRFWGPTYVSYSQLSAFSACGFEFGADGYAGCCNYGGKLLQMSAPSPRDGLIFARGDFPVSFYSSLARVQKTAGGRSTFGLEVARDLPEPASPSSEPYRISIIRLGEMIERGCFNYRWPFNKYYLLSNGDSTEVPGNTSSIIGVGAMLSFVKNGVVYQLLQITTALHGIDVDKQSNLGEFREFPGGQKIALSIGGPVSFQSYQSWEKEPGKLEDHSIKEVDGSTGRIRLVDVDLDIMLEAEIYELDGFGKFQPLPLAPLTGQVGEDLKARWDGSNPLNSYYAVGNFDKSTATFMAAFRLTEWDEFSDWPQTPPTSEDIYHHIGIDTSSDLATGTMWQTVFLERGKGKIPLQELTEINLLGRCLEKVLQVDLVPAFDPGDEKTPYLALVSNVFLQPNIDLESLFWKLRFLVGVHKFLSRHNSDEHHHSHQSLEGHQCLLKRSASIVKAQLDRIHHSVEQITLYLITNLLTSEPTTTKLMPNDLPVGDPQLYYVMIAVWYAIRAFPDIIPNAFSIEPAEDTWLSARLPPDNWNMDGAHNESAVLLKWYHYSSIMNLHEAHVIPGSWIGNDGLQIGGIVNNLENTAKTYSAIKSSTRQAYVPSDEIFDRLSFLADELGLASLDQATETISSLSLQRMQRRDFTRHLNPGIRAVGGEGSIKGPWEIHALSHQSYLNLLILEYTKPDGPAMTTEKIQETDVYRQNLCEFLNSEATLVPCWERAHYNIRGSWLHSEATCVLASTLLAIREKEIEMATQRPPKEAGYVSDPSSKDVGPKRNTEGVSALDFGLINFQTELQPSGTKKLSGEIIQHPSRINWLIFRPPRQYHPDNFTNSLEDTPLFYNLHYMKSLSIPLVFQSYLPMPGETAFRLEPDPEDPNYYRTSKEEVHLTAEPNIFTIKDVDSALMGAVGSASVFDIKATEETELKGQGPWVRGTTIPGRVRHIYHISRPRDVNQQELHPDDIAGAYPLTKALFDSLVDQEVQHRIITIRWLTNDLLKLLTYVVHTESIPCLRNHLLCVSRFTCQRGNAWAAMITLRSWSPTSPKDKLFRVWRESETFDEQNPSVEQNPSIRGDPGTALSKSSGKFRMILKTALFRSRSTPTTALPADRSRKIPERSPDENIEFPKKLQERMKKAGEDPTPLSYHLKMSSFIISTNAFGDFSKCTIVSDLIKESDLKRLTDKAHILWQEFIHQPQTARCLVFFLVLGVMCQEVARDYEEALERLSELLSFEDVFFEEAEWSRDKKSVPKLKSALWSLESLCKLQASLKQSVDSVIHSKEDLMAQIREGPGMRSEALEDRCEEYLTSFDSALVKLTAVDASLERQIQRSSRYKDALLAVLTLRDSRASLSQNSAVQRLTYLTIAYLPLAFIAALFAIPREQNVIRNGMGVKWFVGSILILSAATYVAAIYIGTIFGLFGEMVRFMGKLLKKLGGMSNRLFTTLLENVSSLGAVFKGS